MQSPAAPVVRHHAWTADHPSSDVSNPAGPGSNLTILAWHNITASPFFYGGPDAFARQLRLIRRLGTPVALGPAIDALRNGGPLPRRAVAITFDDGYRDNVEVALPILRELGIPATFFLVPGYLSRTSRCWWETVAWALGRTRESGVEWRGRVLSMPDAPRRRAVASTICADLKHETQIVRDRMITDLIDQLRPVGSQDEVAELFMDWDGARRLARHMEIGSHTCEHPILSLESAADQRLDLECSRDQLQSGLDVSVDLLAYPNGSADDYDDVTVAAAMDAGYSGAVTTIEGVNGRTTPAYELRRFVFGPRWDAGTIGFLSRIFLSAARGRTA